MQNYIEITLTIGVSIDNEYSPEEHAEDIVKNTCRLFPTAVVTVNKMEARYLDETVQPIQL